MHKGILKWIREHYNAIRGSIAFYPVLIALGFLAISIAMLEVDFSEQGKAFKSTLQWIRLRDADTARVIVSTIAAGLISLTVFSFSMVMIVLNQAASQLSNRILENLIGNRSQQFVLGIYLGTIVYGLFLLSSIRDIDEGLSIPSLSIFLLILLTVIDIFVFIYFLHFITQSVKYQTLIHHIEKQTEKVLEKPLPSCVSAKDWQPAGAPIEVPCPESSYFQQARIDALVKMAGKANLQLEFLHPRSTFLLKGVPFLLVYSKTPVSQEQIDALFLHIDFYRDQAIEVNPYYGFWHLSEVAIKALSPGINDPVTAVLCLQALTHLLTHRLHHPPPRIYEDEEGVPRLSLKEYDFAYLLHYCILPIWNYGKNDLYVRQALTNLLHQLKYLDKENKEGKAIEDLLAKINKEQDS